MAFALSPGVTVLEQDFSATVPAVSTSAGAVAGVFSWGPVMEPTTVNSEDTLVQRFGKPNDNNFTSFFTAANFLSYTNNLLLVRAKTTGLANACEVSTEVPLLIQNETEFSGSVYTANGVFAARYAGALGNGLQVVVVDRAAYDWANNSAQDNNTIAKVIRAVFGTATSTDAMFQSNAAKAKTIVDDEMHVLVLDSAIGTWTGTPNYVLEKFANLSKLKGVQRSDGTNAYWADAINVGSKYIYALTAPAAGQLDAGDLAWGDDIVTADVESTVKPLKTTNVNFTLAYGADDWAVADADLQTAYELLNDTETYDISLIATGEASPTLANAVIAVAESRKDCVVFVSPNTDNDPIIAKGSDGVDAVKEYISTLTNSTYAFVDTGYKYQYDRYNDVYRWVPLNGDVAGLCARTDLTTDPWFSPGGFTRGQVKNVVKLGFNPDKTSRDQLYVAGVNPVVQFPGQGAVLYGDKTFTQKASAFDRINVRRLFIVLEKAISKAAKYQLFEFNDEFTRAQFRNLVEPFLRTVQGRRGITDFRVKCDASNNTGDVIDRNEFVANIFIKPNRSINFITLTFTAARTGISFQEIGG